VGEHAGALPNLVVVGAMKCGTTALHGFLDRHPEIAMSDPKELNFFFGPAAGSGDDAPWAEGNRHRGVGWYRHQFPAAAPVRGESSPGYTSPSEPHVAARMAALIPGARLVYLVRDPVERAVSQYHHHRADGTEPRPLDAALLDPHSQYVDRGRYHARLTPFLRHFPRSRIAVVAREGLLADPRGRCVRCLEPDGSGASVEVSHQKPSSTPRKATSPPPDRRLRAGLSAPCGTTPTASATSPAATSPAGRV